MSRFSARLWLTGAPRWASFSGVVLEQGIGADAVRTVVRYGFAELGLHRISWVSGPSTRERWPRTDRRLREEGRRARSFSRRRWYDELLMGQLGNRVAG